MSRLGETKQAYDRLVKLLDAEILKRKGSTSELERFRSSLDVAFYLLGWAQFEFLVRQEANEVVEDKARAKTVDGHAWRYLQNNLKALSVRERLDIIFHTDRATASTLHGSYSIRNEAAHNYKMLPREAKDISGWLEHLENLVDKFEP